MGLQTFVWVKKKESRTSNRGNVILVVFTSHIHLLLRARDSVVATCFLSLATFSISPI